jgi:VCBS repeat-containing protein
MRRFSGIVGSTVFRRVLLVLALTLVVRHLELAQTAPARHHSSGPPAPGSFPRANDDAYTVRRGDLLTVSAANGVLANDSDPQGKPLTATLFSNPAHGAIFLNADGSFAYANDGTSAESDSFTYGASDGSKSSPARVTITIIADRPPIASNDSYTAAPGTTLTSAAPGILANDTDPDGDPLTAILVSGVSHGTLTLNANGSFTYTSDAGNAAADSFTYQASDGTLQSNAATVTITIDSAIHANADTFGAAQNTPRAVDAPGVLSNDVLNGSKIVSFGSQTGSEQTQLGASTPTTAGGSVALNADGSLRFSPAPNFAGADTFKYTLANAASRQTGIVLMMVFAPPQANADSYAVSSAGATITKPGILSNDVVSGATITGYGAVSGTEQTAIGSPTPTVKGGSITLRADGSFTYAPPATLSGTDTFRYTLSNYAGASPATVILTVSAVPLAAADTYQAAVNTARAVATASGVLANDSPNGAAIVSYGINGNEQSALGSPVATTRGGTIALNQDGSFSYAPPAGYTGADFFKYTLTGAAGSSIATVTVTVFAPPAAASDSYQVSPNTTRNATAAQGVLANDTPNGATIAAYGPTAASQQTQAGQAAQTSKGGTVVVNGDGSFSYTPAANFTGSDTFAYTLSNFAGSSVASVTLAVSAIPLAVNDNYQTASNASRTVPASSGVLANDSPNGAAIVSYGATTGQETASIGSATPTAAGNQVVLNADGSFTYTTSGFTGSDSFKYRLSNASGAATATVTIAVTGAPLAVNDNYQVSKNISFSSFAPGVLANDTMSGGAIASYGPSTANEQTTLGGQAPTAQGGTIALNGDGSFNYSPPPNFLGSDSFRYVLSNIGGRSTATVTFTVSSAPFAANDSYVAVNATPMAISAPGVLTNDTLNGATITSFGVNGTEQTALGQPAPTMSGGTIILNANGSFSYTPPATSTLNDAFHYVLTNANGSSTATVTFIVALKCASFSINPITLAAGAAGTAYAPVTFARTGGVAPFTWALTGTLPAGMALSSAGVLSGTPAQTGTYNLTVTVTDANGCTATISLPLIINCPVVMISPATLQGGAVGTVYPPVSFAQAGGVGTIAWSSGTLPPGMSLSAAGVLSGTPTAPGSFSITIRTTDANSCAGVATPTLVVGCPTITITPPNTIAPGTLPSGVAGVLYPAATFAQSGGVAPIAWSVSTGTLPAGMSFSSAGVLSGTPSVTGSSFAFTVKATDANGCTGMLTVSLAVNARCPAIAISPTALPAGTAGVVYPALSFTQTGGAAPVTWASGALPAGMTFSTSGVLAGTPAATGVFNISVTATDANGCSATLAVPLGIGVTCPAITITPVSLAAGISGVAYTAVNLSETGGVGAVTWSLVTPALPAGMSLSNAGVLSGTPAQTGTFPFTVKATDANGCFGTLNLSITVNPRCPSISITAPLTLTNGIAGVPYPAINFTQSGGAGLITWSSGALPAGMSFSTAGVFSGTPIVRGTFNITVQATDANGCIGTQAQTFTIDCPTIAINPVHVIAPMTLANGRVGSAYTAVNFSASGGVGTLTWSESGTLPAGMSFSSLGVLSGTPVQGGTYPAITITATDTNGCSATTAPYMLVIDCQPMTVTNPVTATGTAGSQFSATFTQSGGISTTLLTTTSTVPAGLALASNGVLSGVPIQVGTFPLTVIATDANGCSAIGAVYNLVIGCQSIPVTNPAATTGTTGSPFSQSFTAAGTIGAVSFTTAGSLPAGLTLHPTTGVLDGTPAQTGTFPILVKAVDRNGCAGTGGVYNLVIGCGPITVTNPITAGGNVNIPFSQQFNASGTNGALTFTLGGGVLPAGLSLSPTGLLSGTPTSFGSFPIQVRVTDANGCQGTGATYPLVIGCPTISVTNPLVEAGTVGSPFSQNFTTNAAGAVTFTTNNSLPRGLGLDSGGTLSGTPSQGGTFPIVVTVVDQNGCSGTGATYTLNIANTRLYAANEDGTGRDPGDVSVFTLNANGDITGQQTGSPFVADSVPLAVAVHPSAMRLYVANLRSDDVTVYRLNASGDIINQQPFSPIFSGRLPFALAVHPNGRRLYVANLGEDTVTVFTLDGNGDINGQQSFSPFPTGRSPKAVALNPAGTRLYIANGTTNDVTVYMLDPSGNIVSQQPGSPFAAGDDPIAVALNAAGTRLYVLSDNSSNVTVYMLDGSGNITGQQPGSPFVVGDHPGGFVSNAAGTRLYVTNEFSSDLTVFMLDASGNITGEQPGSPFAVQDPSVVAVNGAGTRLYVANYFSASSSSMTVFILDRNGSITGQQSGSPFLASPGPLGLAVR